MAKYLVDHKNKRIHRSAYVGDKCKLPHVPLHMREGENTDQNFNNYKEKGYKNCVYCFYGPTFDGIEF
ncbi:hypothetical protein [Pseudalkalibacillus decolorationis]|uniref:hypothetical protein n=1 Tax=Pseudalkalibacillus decolorationis TaxID=163879 RepID=UPI002148BFB8|nr:hypothetical protein [Pseudalkalibacillus decolorationis]